MPKTANIALSSLDNNYLVNDSNTYIVPKSGTVKERQNVHLHLIYAKSGALDEVLLSFPDFTSSGTRKNHVQLAKVSGTTWTFTRGSVFSALATMKNETNQINNQIWQVGHIPMAPYKREESILIQEQLAQAKLFARYVVLTLELLSGLEAATGTELGSELNPGQ